MRLIARGFWSFGQFLSDFVETLWLFLIKYGSKNNILFNLKIMRERFIGDCGIRGGALQDTPRVVDRSDESIGKPPGDVVWRSLDDPKVRRDLFKWFGVPVPQEIENEIKAGKDKIEDVLVENGGVG